MNHPKESKLIKSQIRDVDTRGDILSIVDKEVSNVSIITCNPGSIRSNHYHKKDFHYMYVLEGKIDYFYKSLYNENIKYFSVLPGDNIFTPNEEIHATYFPVKTKLIVSSGFPRDQLTYEADTVRVKFIDHNNIDTMLLKHAK
jgi:quercetin dioxygenase-like cupin family protein